MKLLANRLFNTPLLVSPTYLETVCRFMEGRLAGEKNVPGLVYEGKEPVKTTSFYCEVDSSPVVSDEVNSDAPAQIAMVPVMGSLFQRPRGISGGRDYKAIKEDIKFVLSDSDVGGIALMLDTPGGELAGNFDLSRWIKNIQSETGKPIWSIVDEAAYSAGYSIASAGERIITTRSGGVGSIGVVVAHANYEKAMEDAGIEVTYIHGGKHKVDGNPYKALSADVLAEWQASIDFHYGDFVELVAQNRDMKESDIRSTEARTFNSAEALRIRLVDEVMTADDALREFYAHINKPSGSSAAQPQGNSMKDEDIKAKAELEQRVEAAEKRATAAEDNAKDAATAAAAEVHSRYQAVLGDRLTESATTLIESNLSIEEVKKIMGDTSPFKPSEAAPAAGSQPTDVLSMMRSNGAFMDPQTHSQGHDALQKGGHGAAAAADITGVGEFGAMLVDAYPQNRAPVRGRS